MGWLVMSIFALGLIKLMEIAGLYQVADTQAQPQVGLPQATPPSSTPHPIVAAGAKVGGIRRTLSGWREWRRADPTLINSLWRSKMGNGIRKQLGNAEVYIILALLIGVVTVVIGCWLSDNCWSPEPDTGGISLA